MKGGELKIGDTVTTTGLVPQDAKLNNRKVVLAGFDENTNLWRVKFVDFNKEMYLNPENLRPIPPNRLSGTSRERRENANRRQKKFLRPDS